ncbi:MAG: hypothetical protein LBC96_06395 [Lachnospiraceae bacterium]|jgi:hypothetical protein|nr:hypothetical protein [Lachnospiraceae bacterium]
MFCIYCRNPFEAGSVNICSGCGKRLYKEDKSRREPKKEKMNEADDSQTDDSQTDDHQSDSAETDTPDGDSLDFDSPDRDLSISDGDLLPDAPDLGLDLLYNCRSCGMEFPALCLLCATPIAAETTIPLAGWLICATCKKPTWVMCPHCRRTQEDTSSQRESREIKNEQVERAGEQSGTEPGSDLGSQGQSGTAGQSGSADATTGGSRGGSGRSGYSDISDIVSKYTPPWDEQLGNPPGNPPSNPPRPPGNPPGGRDNRASNPGGRQPQDYRPSRGQASTRQRPRGTPSHLQPTPEPWDEYRERLPAWDEGLNRNNPTPPTTTPPPHRLDGPIFPPEPRQPDRLPDDGRRKPRFKLKDEPKKKGKGLVPCLIALLTAAFLGGYFNGCFDPNTIVGEWVMEEYADDLASVTGGYIEFTRNGQYWGGATPEYTKASGFDKIQVGFGSVYTTDGNHLRLITNPLIDYGLNYDFKIEDGRLTMVSHEMGTTMVYVRYKGTGW